MVVPRFGRHGIGANGDPRNVEQRLVLEAVAALHARTHRQMRRKGSRNGKEDGGLELWRVEVALPGRALNTTSLPYGSIHILD